MCLLTNSVISAVEKFCERSSGSLLLNHDSSLLVSSQLTQHACSHFLDVLNLVVEQLDKDGEDGESSDDGSVVLLPGQDVEGAHGALHYLLHPSSPCCIVGARSLLSLSVVSASSLCVLEC